MVTPNSIVSDMRWSFAVSLLVHNNLLYYAQSTPSRLQRRGSAGKWLLSRKGMRCFLVSPRIVGDGSLPHTERDRFPHKSGETLTAMKAGWVRMARRRQEAR